MCYVCQLAHDKYDIYRPKCCDTSSRRVADTTQGSCCLPLPFALAMLFSACTTYFYYLVIHIPIFTFRHTLVNILHLQSSYHTGSTTTINKHIISTINLVFLAKTLAYHLVLTIGQVPTFTKGKNTNSTLASYSLLQIYLVLSVCPQQIIIFRICFCPLPDDKKRTPLGETISTRQNLLSTNRNWRS